MGEGRSLWAMQRPELVLALLIGVVVMLYHSWQTAAACALTVFMIKQPFLLWAYFRPGYIETSSAFVRRMHVLWSKEDIYVHIAVVYGLLFGLSLDWMRGLCFGFLILLTSQPFVLWSYFKEPR